MAEFKLNLAGVLQLKDHIKTALQYGAAQLKDDIVAIAPRDPNRLPKDPSKKVTGNLKRSIATQVNDDLSVKIWVDLEHNLPEGKTPIMEYARYQEFWTPNMPARSYLRKGIAEHGKDAMNTFIYKLKKLLKW